MLNEQTALREAFKPKDQPSHGNRREMGYPCDSNQASERSKSRDPSLD